MSQEFEKLSLVHPPPPPPAYRNVHSFSSSDDDVLYSSPSNDFPILSSVLPPLLSSSYDENLSTNVSKTTERYFGRSRLITTSLDEIPLNNNAQDHPSYSSLLRPSWYTSPSPQWRLDDQQMILSAPDEKSFITDFHNIQSIKSKHLLRKNMTDYSNQRHEYFEKCANQHRNDQRSTGYSLMNTSTPLINDASIGFPMIQDKSSNLLMFL